MRFELAYIFNRFPHLRAHSHEHAEHRGARGIQTDVANEKVATGLSRCSREPVGRRGKVARNVEIARFGNLIAKNRDRSVLFPGSPHEKITQHALGVIATLGFLDN